MSQAQQRLVELIDFVKESARLRTKSVAAVSDHRQFSLYEHQLHGLPGIRLNLGGAEGDDEIWLAVSRLHETTPPRIESPTLEPWVQMTQEPDTAPTLRPSIARSGLPLSEGDKRRPAGPPPVGELIALADYEHAGDVRARFEAYLIKWQRWAQEEIPRRKTIRIYAQLFTLKQQLEGGIVEAQLELVWGLGVGVWEHPAGSVNYPLLGQLSEISIDDRTSTIEVRPRDVDARVELDWYIASDNPGVAKVEKAAREFFSKISTTFSPFDRATFEPLLRTASSHLDSHARYWPDHARADDRSVPRPEKYLTITDTWVLFARPRSTNPLIQDLERLRKQAEGTASYPPAVRAIVTDPATDNPVPDLPVFRGMSGYCHAGSESRGKAEELYFPKPFNDEQIRIVQLLEVSDGVVVQGPPGTGKTHTIANVICHYLAKGKRVLVTSMKDPALSVLQDKLPPEIRPLAIPLLTSEQQGMKQFEHAIQKIASEVQSLDRAATARDIRQIEASIDAYHGQLATIDHAIREWAHKNLERIALDSESIDPVDAARAVVEAGDRAHWLPDTIGIVPEYAPRFSDVDIVQLREARRALGQDLEYLSTRLPQIVEFPDAIALVQTHRDLAQFEQLKASVDRGDVPPLSDASQETVGRAQALLADVDGVEKLRQQVDAAGCPWSGALRDLMHRNGQRDALALLESLGHELLRAQEGRAAFLQRPVSVPNDLDIDTECMAAVERLAAGERAFGILKAIVGRSEPKKRISAVRVMGRPPQGPGDWKHVASYVSHQRRLRELAERWNALAAELPLEPVQAGASGGLEAGRLYNVCLSIRAMADAERAVAHAAASIFPSWSEIRGLASNSELLPELRRTLHHHLTKNRLASVWGHRENGQRVLAGCGGPIVEVLRRFFASDLGNPAFTDAELQTRWTGLMAELSRLHGLKGHFAIVRDVTARIEASGAPRWAAALRQPMREAVDSILPDHWQGDWRLKRLATHLDQIDSRRELPRLEKARKELEANLAHAYRDMVVKRTWLMLSERASHSVRAALQAYLNAIQRIGKGTGKRAVRYRADARAAASQATGAVPCWIMAHYRVSESLPAEIGCFDLVVIDEASQSDLTALPALLRAQKVLIVGDDKQVSPEGVGLEEDKVKALMGRGLGSQVRTYASQMSPERSIYDLFKVVFANSGVMLKEHFRCVGPIIEYSRREFYNGELRPLRLPMASERLDPPLVDVLVQDGFRNGDLNRAEIRVIVEEIRALTESATTMGRSIGVVSLLGDKQALAVWDALNAELGPETIQRHKITCGDARNFQGNERDIMFLSMVSAPNEVGAALSRDTYAQRFNVAGSRARDRMYLVRSLSAEQLPAADVLRRKLIEHFASPYAQDESRVVDLRTLCESPFERELYDEITGRGYRVTPQVRVGHFRIDMVVEGDKDCRLAVECDGDRYHGPDKWADDMQRQRILERAGWAFWRCFASAFVRRRREVLEDLVATLHARGIEPLGADGASRSVHVEHRVAASDSLPPVTSRAAAIKSTAEDVHQAAPSAMIRPVTAAKVPVAGTTDEAARPSAPSRDPIPSRRQAFQNRSRLAVMIEQLVGAGECDTCRGTRWVHVRSNAVLLVCGTVGCGQGVKVSADVLEAALKALDVKCADENCGAPMKAVAWSLGFFAGCTRYPRCKKSLSWPDLDKRLQS